MVNIPIPGIPDADALDLLYAHHDSLKVSRKREVLPKIDVRNIVIQEALNNLATDVVNDPLHSNVSQKMIFAALGIKTKRDGTLIAMPGSYAKRIIRLQR